MGGGFAPWRDATAPPMAWRSREPTAGPIAGLIAYLDDASPLAALRNLGGHDIGALTDAFDSIDDACPTVIFAYTVKGYGLPTQGHPQNHSSLLTADQMTALADRLGTDPNHPWRAFAAGSPEAALCAAIAGRLHRSEPAAQKPPALPSDLDRPAPTGTGTTQQALGRVLLALTRRAPRAASRIVTVSPDVSSSTNLGGWLNKVGVWSPTER